MAHLIRIRIYSHHFVADQLGRAAQNACFAMANQLMQWGLVPERGRMVRKAQRTFCSATKSRSEFRFLLGHLEAFESLLERFGIPKALILKTEMPLYEPFRCEFKLQPQWEARDYQLPIIDYLAAPQPAKKFLSLQTGKGKAQPLNAKVKIPGGWSTMGEMKTGTKIIAANGEVAEVYAIHPQGTIAIYEITFEDGRKTQASAEHLWQVQHQLLGHERALETCDTLRLQELVSTPNRGVEIDLIVPEATPDQILPISPMEMGIILSRARNHDVFVRKHKVALEQFGLLNVEHEDLEIPEIYLKASVLQRMQLLSSLIKGTGWPSTQGGDVFRSKSIRLIKQVQELTWSLGGKAFVRIADLSAAPGVHRELSWGMHNVRIEFAVQGDPHPMMLRVKSIERVEDKQAQCITITHPSSLYITDDYVVTHNSFCSMSAMLQMGMRTLLIIRPMFVEKWIQDIKRTYEISDEDICDVQGSKQLMNLLARAEAGTLTEKIIIVSNRTYQMWLKNYEMYGAASKELGYPCLPQDFCEFVQAGVRLIDETHMDLHLCSKIDQYSHVPYSIGLSATLITQDPFINKIYQVMFPMKDRYKELPLDKYIDVYAVMYRFEQPERIRTQEFGSTNFSNNAVEKSVMRHPATLRNYFKLIEFCIRDGFDRNPRKKKKLIIYALSGEMIDLMVKHFKALYPQYDVRRYMMEDAFDDLLESDICITTIGSAGTAVDVPNLTNTIVTISINSIQSNVQTLGRLRKLEEGIPVQMHYFVATDIPKSMEYHKNKMELFSNRAKSHNVVNSGFVV